MTLSSRDSFARTLSLYKLSKFKLVKGGNNVNDDESTTTTKTTITTTTTTTITQRDKMSGISRE